MRRSDRNRGQLELLSWQPPQPVVRFDSIRVRAASLGSRIARAISESLRDCGEARDTIAERMSSFLGERVSRAMLDAYASEAREDHKISLIRFIALLEVTRDRRALEMIAERYGWCVIERRYLPLIELAMLREHQDEVKRRAAMLRSGARAEGLV